MTIVDEAIKVAKSLTKYQKTSQEKPKETSMAHISKKVRKTMGRVSTKEGGKKSNTIVEETTKRGRSPLFLARNAIFVKFPIMPRIVPSWKS